MARNHQNRFNFVDRLCSSIQKWQGPLPNVRDIFYREEIDWLLEELIEPDEVNSVIDPRPFVDFLIKTGYKDEPEVDEDGKPVLRRTTPLHQAAWNERTSLIPDLFEIYDRFDANYCDERGYTHFHVACRHGLKDIVKKFLDHGQDPDVVLPETDESPLYLALKRKHNKVAELLLSNGADPNLPNKNGWTLLHSICDVDKAKLLFEYSKDLPVQVDARDNRGNTPLHIAMRDSNIKKIAMLLRRGADPNAANEAGWTPLHFVCKENWNSDGEVMEKFFRINEKANRTVRVDAKDKLGRTPLQWAVANFCLLNVDVLLSRGAEMSNFVFPTENYYGARYDRIVGISPCVRLEMASGALLAVEILEAAGRGSYALDRNDALTIMNFFAKYELFEESTNLGEKYWANDEEFARQARAIAIKPGLSIYAAIVSRPAQAAKRLAYRDYYVLARSWKFYSNPKRHQRACVARMCETLSRRFFRRWALDPLLELTHYKLPIVCCDKIMDHLMNQDLYQLCLPVTSQN